MDDNTDFRKSVLKLYRLMMLLFVFIAFISILGVYLMADPTLSAFKDQTPQETIAAIPEDDYDNVENGIHVRTGFIDAPGLAETVNNCTNCHSSKLVLQNRMDKEGWIATIKWMQETQNLWDLGKNEAIIVDYLVTNYPPKKMGRRENLNDIDWYILDK